MQAQPTNSFKRGKYLMAGTYVTAGTMVALLIAALYNAPEMVFVTVAVAGLAATVGAWMVADRFSR